MPCCPFHRREPEPPYAVAVGTGNVLYYGDNLHVLRQHVPDESVDLVYLDPPFNSNATYNVLFKTHTGDAASAQLQAFDDTWHWSAQCDEQYAAMMAGAVPSRVAVTIEAMRKLLADRSDMMAYLVMMAPRLAELHRVLKPTGSLYLHCDSNAAHYLKLLLDAVFGPENFRNDIAWKRKAGRGETNNAARRFGVSHDDLLFYARSSETPFNRQYRASNPDYIASKFTHVEADTGRVYRLDNITSPSPRPNLVYEYKGYNPPPNGWAVSRERMEEMDAEGRLYLPANKSHRIQRKRYLDELEGETVDSLWDDIPPINSMAQERLGYPTQKPLALLERIIAASSNLGDLVLDPFCGCGTTIDAAQKLDRRWVGIDITYIAVDLIRKRLFHTYGPGIDKAYEVHGIPTDREGAAALFAENPLDFERWAVSLVQGTPNDKQVGDKGVDGRIRFYGAGGELSTAIVSVKGGQTVSPTFARDLVGTMSQQHAEMGVLITQGIATRGVREVADEAGVYVHEPTGTSFPRLQLFTVDQLLRGERPKMPTPLTPYIKAPSRQGVQQQLFGS